jgi:ribosomal protein L37AE/L43A
VSAPGAGPGGPGGERAVALHCPYCGEEDLRPHEQAHGAWECRGCARVFSVKLLGLAGEALREVTR